MNNTKWPALLGLAACTTILTFNIDSTFAFDKPVHTAIVLFGAIGAVLLSITYVLIRTGHKASLKGYTYDAVAFNETGRQHGDSQGQILSGLLSDPRLPRNLRNAPALAIVTAAALTIRVELCRRILANVECATSSYEPLVPLVFGLHDFWVRRRTKTSNAELQDDVEKTIYDEFATHLFNSPLYHLALVLLVCFGGWLSIHSASNPASTYICPLHLIRTIPFLQHLATALDVFLIFCFSRILRGNNIDSVESPDHKSDDVSAFRNLAFAFLGSSILLSLLGFIHFILSTPSERLWIIEFSANYFWGTVNFVVLGTLCTVCTLFSVYHFGVLTTSITITCVSTATATTSLVWSNSHSYPPISSPGAFLSVLASIIGFAAYMSPQDAETRASHARKNLGFSKVSSLFYLALVCYFIVHLWFLIWHSGTVTYHPIDFLIWEAHARHNMYRNQTLASTSLGEAVDIYSKRYGRSPPPRFDAWYEYATSRKSKIIDDYDSMWSDLIPFFARSPDEIRQRSWELVVSPWNDVGAISIRRGEASIVNATITPTQRGMLHVTVEMINKFAKHLPDMDLPFNLYDGPRVAVHYSGLEQMLAAGPSTQSQSSKADFQPDRSSYWKSIPETPVDNPIFEEKSTENIFHSYGNVACRPSSAALSHRWNLGSSCPTCTSPHSLGAFMANWTLASDICYQPDLADLHGQYTSPALFKGTHGLYPVFSTSKLHGFNDILYPSGSDYSDPVAYSASPAGGDVPWSAKKNAIFWRGGTNEGVSNGQGQWKGMARQRFVHLANDDTSTASSALLLPTTNDENEKNKRFAYKYVEGKKLRELLQTDIAFEGTMTNCNGRDCTDQQREFAPSNSTATISTHLENKFILTLDDPKAFQQILHSGSLPFHTSLSREWYSDRLTPWVHFVPLDIRGHGFWATLAYFAGVEGSIRGREVKVAARDDHGQQIARQGREWANDVLSRGDMEIYMFRLLLEWARLTDDDRDVLGFEVDAIGDGDVSSGGQGEVAGEDQDEPKEKGKGEGKDKPKHEPGVLDGSTAKGTDVWGDALGFGLGSMEDE